MRRPAQCCCLLLAAASAVAADVAPAGDPVRVYRCVDARGNVSLGDVPCPAGSTGRTLEMQRPTDGAPLNRVVRSPPATPAPAPQVVVTRAPQAMYECETPDGERYTSDSDAGNPRWVPLWTLGYGGGWGPGRPHPGGGAGGGGALGEYYANRPRGGSVGAPTPKPGSGNAIGQHRPPPPPSHPPTPRPPPHGPGHGRPVAYGAGGTWVRDTCRALPQAEVCARLRDRREEIRRRFFNAQERERDTLRVEERGINARLAADCPTY